MKRESRESLQYVKSRILQTVAELNTVMAESVVEQIALNDITLALLSASELTSVLLKDTFKKTDTKGDHDNAKNNS